MNNKTAIVLIIFSIIFASGVPTTLAKPEFVKNLNEVYGTGSCNTCHVNGSSDGPRTSYGKLFEDKMERGSNATAALRAIGTPMAANQTATSTKTHETTETPKVTTSAPTATKASPGFGMMASLTGLLILAYFIRRKNL